MPKKVGTPIQLTLYDPDNGDEVAVINGRPAEFSRLIVPWGLLKRVMIFLKSTDVSEPTSLTEENIDMMSALIVELFGNQFTITDVERGADVTDMISVLQMVTAKAQGILPNPTPATS